MNILYKTCIIIAAIGCINWGLLGIFNFNLVEFLFGKATIITKIVYVLVLLQELYNLEFLLKI